MDKELMTRKEILESLSNAKFNKHDTREIVEKNWMEKIFWGGDFRCDYCFDFFKELVKKDLVTIALNEGENDEVDDVLNDLSDSATSPWNERRVKERKENSNTNIKVINTVDRVSDSFAFAWNEYVDSITRCAMSYKDGGNIQGDMTTYLLQNTTMLYLVTQFLIPAEFSSNGYNDFTEDALFGECWIENIVPNISFCYVKGIELNEEELVSILNQSTDLLEDVTSGDIMKFNNVMYKIGRIIDATMMTFDIDRNEFILQMYRVCNGLYHTEILEIPEEEFENDIFKGCVSEIERIQYSPIIILLDQHPNLRKVLEAMAIKYGSYVSDEWADGIAEVLGKFYGVELTRQIDNDPNKDLNDYASVRFSYVLSEDVPSQRHRKLNSIVSRTLECVEDPDDTDEETKKVESEED